MVSLSRSMFALTFHVKFSSPGEISYCGGQAVVVLPNWLSLCWRYNALLAPPYSLTLPVSPCILPAQLKRTLISFFFSSSSFFPIGDAKRIIIGDAKRIIVYANRKGVIGKHIWLNTQETDNWCKDGKNVSVHVK